MTPYLESVKTLSMQRTNTPSDAHGRPNNVAPLSNSGARAVVWEAGQELSGKGRPLRQTIIHKLGLFALQQFSASSLTLFQLLDVDF